MCDLDLGCDAYGVNNRDLVTFEVDLDISIELAASLPEGAVRISESGIRSRSDIDYLREAGFHAFLIGESLMRQPDPGAALAGWLQPAVLAAPQREPQAKPQTEYR